MCVTSHHHGKGASRLDLLRINALYVYDLFGIWGLSSSLCQLTPPESAIASQGALAWPFGAFLTSSTNLYVLDFIYAIAEWL